MFKKNHPFLFFILILCITFSTFTVVMTLVLSSVVSGDGISGEKVGIINITGVITDSEETVRQIKKFRENEKIKAIIVRINSPGGAVGPSQEIYREIIKTKDEKKVIASMGSVAASGGYYIASATDGIMANPGTITGSIGVILGFTNYKQLFDKIGLVPVVIKSGDHKDIGSPVKEMSEEERMILQSLSDDIHDQFITDVATGRGMDSEDVRKLADGRVYSGKSALELGMIDKLGNLEDAITWAAELGGIDGKTEGVYPPEHDASFLKFLKEFILSEIETKSFDNSLKAEYIFRP